MSSKRIARNLAGGSFVKQARCSENLLKKVYDGVLVSDFTRHEIRRSLLRKG